MADNKEPNPCLVDASYKVTGGWYSTVDVNGNTAIIHGNNGTSHSMSITLGNFGDSDPEIAKSTGQQNSNIELSYTFAFKGSVFTDIGDFKILTLVRVIEPICINLTPTLICPDSL